MIRITRQTDYGIILLAYLASRSREAIHTAKDAARECSLPVPMVSKILKTLAREGILVSHRGVKGGYRSSPPTPRASRWATSSERSRGRSA